MTVYDETVSKNMCIGCGICVAACTSNCIHMIYNTEKEYVPIVNKSLCTECGQCVKFCPHSTANKNAEMEDVRNSNNLNTYGLEDATYLWGRDKDSNNVLKSCSGGVTTAIATQLLKQGCVSAVIHAMREYAKCGEEHYSVKISRTEKEVCENRGSIYGPLCFANALFEFRNQSDKILLIGVPCVIRAAKRLFEENTFYKNNKLYTIALMCSHNVNGQYIDFLGESLGIQKNIYYYADLRYKDKKMKNQDEFYTCFRNKKHPIVKMNRFKSLFTETWRNYFFSMPVCNYCSDFWGRDADISVKDAWGNRGNQFRYGSSYLVVRNKQLCNMIYKMKTLEVTRVTMAEIVGCQPQTSDYKQRRAIERYDGKTDAEFEKNQVNMNKSRKLYAEKGYRGCMTMLSNATENFSLQRMMEKITNMNFKLLTKRRIIPNIKKIVVFGGFAGENAGDEAQIDETYRILRKRYPTYEIKILSHVQQYTYEHHYNCAVGESSRISIWNIDQSALYNNIDTYVAKLKFLAMGSWTYLNAFLIKIGMPMLFLNARKASFLYEIQTSQLVYFSGGGYLTGDTLSRLWDHMLVVMIADLFNVPCVMSGHNIGLWNSDFTKRIAAKAFSKVMVISTRDKRESIAALREVGVSGKHIMVTHDDALFCGKIDDVSTIMKPYGRYDRKFIVLCIHDWKVKDKKNLLKKINQITQIMLQRTEYDIVLLPTSKEDKNISNYFAQSCKNPRVYSIKMRDYDFRVIKGVISKSVVCVTMRHHAIIFSAGACVPFISLVKDSYFKQKNEGALEIFEQEKFNIDLNNKLFSEEFGELFREAIEKNDDIRKQLESKIEELKAKREEFMKKVDQCLLK